MDFSGYDLILTPNHRLSASLNTSIPVYSLAQWLEKAYQESGTPKKLLNSHHQLFLITSLIREHFPHYIGLASLAQSAWRLCVHYEIDIHSPSFEKNEDTQLFQSIAKHIEAYYQKNNFTDLEQLMKTLRLPEKTAAFGFEHLTPLESRFLSSGHIIKPLKFAEKITRSAFSDPDTEFKTMALWAIHQPKNLQIACIIPDLEAQREKINYLFDVISTDSKNITFSAVKKLSQYYFIQDALQLLTHDYGDLRQKPSDWAIIFEKQLKLKNFPKTLPLNNEEFQLAEKMMDIFKLYQSYDFMHVLFDYAQAISELTQLCERIPFQVTASKTANIHVVSVLESQGLYFDKAWITGMDTRHWPQQSRPNPFLPFPHTTKTEPNFTSRAQEIIYSYPLQNSDETIIPCEFIKNIPVVDINLNWPLPMVGAQCIEPLADGIAPPVDITLLKYHSSQIFKDHIACPFRAFAKHRLHATKPDETQLGLSALQKGNTVHEVLEKTWAALQTKDNLISYSPEKIRELIDTIIDNTLLKFEKILQPVFIRTEKSRLEKLALDWLELEKSRENFVVIATEKTVETQLGNLPLKLRIDRIDQIGPDKYLIIDYKTSQYDIRGDYLDEPQLALYAVISAISVDNIAYAYLRTGSSKLKQIPVKDMKSQWEQELIKIAQDFLAGNAEVKPKYGEETCRMCDLQTLCRVKSFPNAPLL